MTKEINWADVARQYELSPEELEQEVFKVACIMADMAMDGYNVDGFRFICTLAEYDLKLTVERLTNERY